MTLPLYLTVGIMMDVDRPKNALLTWDPAPNSQASTRSMFVLERQEVGSDFHSQRSSPQLMSPVTE